MWVTPSAASAGCIRSRLALALGLLLACATGVRAQAEPYSARARVESTSDADALSEQETKALERSLGPSFSIAESLPGVVPMFSGVPYLMVRGAAPAASLSYYDGIPLPSLFHVALGPSVVAPELAGETRFDAGIAPARYDAHLGGVISRVGPSLSTMPDHARRLELSLLDAAGLLITPVGPGKLSLSWRYGNPGVMLRLLELDATLRYFDYQLRYETPISARSRLTVVLLGVGDHLGDRTAPADDIDMTVHRLLVRLTTRADRFILGSDLLLSSDASVLGQELSGDALRASEHTYLQWYGGDVRVRAGAQLSSALVHLARGNPPPTVPNSTTGSFTRNRDFMPPEDFLEGQPFTSVPNRSTLGAYGELTWQLLPALRFELGLRADAFVASSHLDTALSPGGRLRLLPTRWLSFKVGAALVHMPRTSPLPIAGIADIELDKGVQEALQTELGTTIDLGGYAKLEANFFYHRYSDAVYSELILDCQGNSNPAAAASSFLSDSNGRSICRGTSLPTASGEAHGVELFLKRDLTQYLSGFVSYTLSFADATARDGTHFTPQYDVRHLLNAVLRYDFGNGLSLSARMHARTGKMAVNTALIRDTLRFERLEFRLPGFFRLDLRAAYAFEVSFGRMEIAAGVQNVTLSREATNRDCVAPNGQLMCEVRYQPFITLPNIAVRADF